MPTTLTIGSPLSLGNATLKLIYGTFLTTIGTSATLPNGLVLTNPLSFFNSNVTHRLGRLPDHVQRCRHIRRDERAPDDPHRRDGHSGGQHHGRRHELADREPASGRRFAADGHAGAVRVQHGLYLGIINIAAGILSLQSAGGLGSGSEGTVVSPARRSRSRGVSPSVKRLAVSGTGAAGTTGAIESVPGGTSINTLSTAITLLGDTTISTDAGQLTVSGAIGGAGALTKVGTGVLTLSAANTYTGATNINAGILEATQRHRPGLLAAGVFVGTVNTSATLQLTAGGTYNAKQLTIAGPGIGLNPAGSGNFLLNRGVLNNNSGTNVWTGNITLNAPGSRTSPADTTIGVAGGQLTIIGSISQAAEQPGRGRYRHPHPRRRRTPSAATSRSTRAR